MDARFARAIVLMAAVFSLGAGYRTENFIVEAPTKELAMEIGRNAERFRRELALQWLGEVMPTWAQPCMLKAQVSPQLGAGGATSFVFDRGEVFGWQMEIQGSRERILDSVLPHEVTHTIFASHFRQPLPRWADEGACTTVEHASERMKQQQMLISFLKTGRGISFSKMFAMKEYPADVMPLYSQGYSLARFLIEQRGRKTYMEFLGQGLQDERWEQAIRDHYEFENLLVLQNSWLEWVKRGSPRLELLTPAGTMLASATAPASKSEAIYRGQSPDDQPVAPTRLIPVAVEPRQPIRSVYAESGYADPAKGAQETVASELAEVAPPNELDPADWHPASTRGLREQQPVAVDAALSSTADEAVPPSEPTPHVAPVEAPRAAKPPRFMAGQYEISPPFSSLANERSQRGSERGAVPLDEADSPTEFVRRPLYDATSGERPLRR